MIIKFIADDGDSVFEPSPSDHYNFPIGYITCLNFGFNPNGQSTNRVFECEIDEIYWENDNTIVYCVIKRKKN